METGLKFDSKSKVSVVFRSVVSCARSRGLTGGGYHLGFIIRSQYNRNVEIDGKEKKLAEVTLPQKVYHVLSA